MELGAAVRVYLDSLPVAIRRDLEVHHLRSKTESSIEERRSRIQNRYGVIGGRFQIQGRARTGWTPRATLF